MRALTLKPHWAYAVAHMNKRVENRSRPIPPALIGQRIAIHAGSEAGFKLAWIDEWDRCSGMTRAERRKCSATPVPLGPGFHNLPVAPRNMHARAIVATAVLEGCCTPDDFAGCSDVLGASRPPWAMSDAAWWWHLADVRVLRRVVPVQRGQLGLWRLDSVTEREVLDAE